MLDKAGRDKLREAAEELNIMKFGSDYVTKRAWFNHHLCTPDTILALLDAIDTAETRERASRTPEQRASDLVFGIKTGVHNVRKPNGDGLPWLGVWPDNSFVCDREELLTAIAAAIRSAPAAKGEG